MATNTTFVSGAVLTAAQMNALPWGTVGKVTRSTGDVTINTLADITGMTLTFTAVANRVYKATWLVNGNKNAASRDSTNVYFTTGANAIVGNISLITMGSTNVGLNFSASCYFTVAAGSVTYKLRGFSSSGDLVINANATVPCFLIIEDVGEQ